MNMNITKNEQKLCQSCMEEHQVSIVEVVEREIFKGLEIEFDSIYEYCQNTDEFLENEDMIRTNSLAMKDAYRSRVGLLTSAEIRAIREKYDISQKDFADILDWSTATITRYENHQVQDRAHDTILRKIDSDPQWFLDILKGAKERLSTKQYIHYFNKACELSKMKKNQYLINSICAIYADIHGETGGVELNLYKVIEVINYLAMRVESLHKVKLMKMLWFSDILNYKRHGKSITGLAYRSLPMGAVPEGYDQIVLLDGVSFDTRRYGEHEGYKFKPVPGFKVKELSAAEIETVDEIINELGSLSTDEIVERMHEEDAYQCTSRSCIIEYSFADRLSLD